MRRILVLRGGALGDFIVTLPALAALRRRWPAARIELVGNATAAEPAVNRGLIDAAHSQHESRWRALFADGTLPQALTTWLAEFDLVVSYWPDPDGDLARRFPIHPGQRFIAAPALPVRSPAAAHYLDALGTVGVHGEPTFHPIAPLHDGATGATQPSHASPDRADTIAIHPGSGSVRKNWPAEHWLHLMARLPSPILLVVGDAEHGRWSPDGLARTPAGARLADGSLRLAVRLPLEQLIAELARCRLYLGHDSGVSHLAAACGVPSVLLFGPTDPTLWAPPAPNVRVVTRGPDLSAISVEDVHAAIAAQLSK